MLKQFTYSTLLIFLTSFLNAQIIFEEDFNGISGDTSGGPGTYNFPEGWLLRNVDNNTPNPVSVGFMNNAWERIEDFYYNVSDSAAFSTSYYAQAEQADDWMWTPPIAIPASGNHFLRWRSIAYSSDFRDGYEVRIMIAPDAPTGGTGDIGNQLTNSDLLFSIAAENSVWTNREIDLNEYNGETVYIAFRNNSTDKFLLLIDDVVVENRNYELDQIIYVKKGATGDGSSWGNEFGELADALISAKNSNEINPGSISQIWVSQGTYKPMYSAIDGNFGNSDGRNNTFLIPPGVNVYGGFEGNETSLEERDFVINETILSGDILDNDLVSGSGEDLVISNNEENIYHVVISTSFGNAGKIDGFTIKGGNANLNSEILVNNFAISNIRGAGLVTYNSEFFIENSKFTGNNSSGSGAAVHNRNSVVEILNSDFEFNSGGTGGAMFNDDSNVEISNAKFNSNLARSNGGAVANMYSETVVTFDFCEFNDNYSEDNGGAVLNSDNATVNINNSKFINNSAGWMGGATYNVSSFLTHKNILFQNNAADLGGAIAIWSNSQNMSLVNVSFYGNNAGQGQAIAVDFNSNSTAPALNRTVNLYNCIVWNNDEFEGNNNLSDNYGIYNVQNSIIQYPGSGYNINGSYINTNPLFNAPGERDFSLSQNSPAINAGENSFFNGLDEFTLDLAGNPRVFDLSNDGIIDIGAYEFQGTIETCPSTTIWDGFAWSSGLPDSGTKAIIDGALTLNSDLEACELEVTTNGNLQIPSGYNFTVNGQIINHSDASSFVVASGANLIQVEDVVNDGNITVLRDSQPMKRLDYTMWSSPVAEQNLFGFSPNTVNGVTNYIGSTGRIYIYDGSNGYVNPNPFTAEAVMNEGVGYLFRSPNNFHATNEEVFAGTFIGAANNGNTTANTIAGNLTSIGNPYPSNIDADLLMGSNAGISTLYFWNNTGTSGNNYATYTSMGGTAAGGGSDIPNGIISVGQGFIVSTTANTVNFDNTMRTTNDEIFFRINEAEKHRFWLDLTNENNEKHNQILIGYMTGATNQVDNQIDGKQFGYEGSSIYSLIDEYKFTIQGRALPFGNSDEVKLGFKAVEAGKFNISLNNFDGLFAEGNTVIYLKDKLLNAFHNLMESKYTFESEAGEFNERFEIVYGTDGTMGIDDLNANNIQIYTQNQNIFVSSKNEKILSVELFDLSGRNIHSNQNVNANIYQIKSNSKGVLVIKVQTQNGETLTKKIINR